MYFILPWQPPGAIAEEAIVEEPAQQEHLKETVVTVSDRVKEDLSGGRLLAAIDDFDFEEISTEHAEPTFVCDIGSVVKNTTCGKWV